MSNKPNDKILTIINDTELRMKSMTLFDTINEYSKNITTWLKQVCNKSSLTDKMQNKTITHWTKESEQDLIFHLLLLLTTIYFLFYNKGTNMSTTKIEAKEKCKHLSTWITVMYGNIEKDNSYKLVLSKENWIQNVYEGVLKYKQIISFISS